jgi:hypothetical protein
MIIKRFLPQRAARGIDRASINVGLPIFDCKPSGRLTEISQRIVSARVFALTGLNLVATSFRAPTAA